jgi:hypothetical protein
VETDGVDPVESVDELVVLRTPRLRSLVIAFLVGALVVSAWSVVHQFDPDPEEHPVINGF